MSIRKLKVLFSVTIVLCFAMMLCSCGGGSSEAEPEIAPEDKVSYMTDGKFNSDAETVFAGIEENLGTIKECSSCGRSNDKKTLYTTWESGKNVKDVEFKFLKHENGEFEDLSDTSEVPEIVQFMVLTSMPGDDSFDASVELGMEGVAKVFQIIDPVEFEGNQENLPATLAEMVNLAVSKISSNQLYGNYNKSIGPYDVSVVVAPKNNTTLAIGVYLETMEGAE